MAHSIMQDSIGTGSFFSATIGAAMVLVLPNTLLNPMTSPIYSGGKKLGGAE
jgi:hypothetical protein